MTVRADGPVTLYAITSTIFLPAVTSISEARSAAEATARRVIQGATPQGATAR